MTDVLSGLLIEDLADGLAKLQAEVKSTVDPTVMPGLRQEAVDVLLEVGFYEGAGMALDLCRGLLGKLK